MLLARFGLLPGVVFRTYKFTDDRVTPQRRARAEERMDAAGREGRDAPPRAEGSWYQDTQDGEVIFLPESALKKADENDE
jgi:hypothetical protein